LVKSRENQRGGEERRKRGGNGAARSPEARRFEVGVRKKKLH